MTAGTPITPRYRVDPTDRLVFGGGQNEAHADAFGQFNGLEDALAGGEAAEKQQVILGFFLEGEVARIDAVQHRAHDVRADVKQRIIRQDARHLLFNVARRGLEIACQRIERLERTRERTCMRHRGAAAGFRLSELDRHDMLAGVTRETARRRHAELGGAAFHAELATLDPVPLADEEVSRILRQMHTAQPRINIGFKVGESVRVKEGPFADFSGQVAEINADHMKLKVLVNIFGRETLVEMDFSQVAKL